MIIVGGAYLEECVSPRFAGLVGPGLRAAIALSGLSPTVHLYSIADHGLADDISATCASLRINLTLKQIPGSGTKPIRFWYSNALRPFVPAVNITPRPHLHVDRKDESVLLLGFLEAEATVVGRSVVYEPEAGAPLNLFAEGKSRAERLSVVLKAQDFRRRLLGRHASDVARNLMSETGAEVIVVRSELGSATVFQGDLPAKEVGPYETRRWHRLGMGNIFSAVFAHHWAECQVNPENAAREACLAAALYNEGGRLLTLPSLYNESRHLHIPLLWDPPRPKVRLEGSNTRYVEKQLFNDAIDALEMLITDVETRVPLSDTELTPVWTDDFSALLILSDFAGADSFDEAARVAMAGKPVISYAEYPRYPTSRLHEVAGVEPTDDFTTAIYRTAVAARRPS